GLPISTEGAIGDFYFSKGYLAFYGPKTSAGWGSGVILGSTQAFGVKTFLIKDVKVNRGTMMDYSPGNSGALTPFIHTGYNLQIPGVNLRRGMTFIYVANKQDYLIPSAMDISNYDDFSWQILDDNNDMDGLKYNHYYLGDNYRFKFRYYALTKNSFHLHIMGYSNSNFYSFITWKNEITADVLVK